MAVIHIMEKRGWVLECQRIRTTIAEIDLIFTKQERVLLVEVKRIDNPWRTFERIQQRQYKALQKNLVFLATNLKKYDFMATVCWVDPENKISFVLVD